MTISEVSKKYDITPDTLRWYEKIGLLKNVNRKESGLRDYNEENCNSISFIKCMRDAGIPVETLLEYMELLSQGKSTLEKRKQLLIKQRENLQKKVDVLLSSISRLDYKIENYEKIMVK